MAYFILRIIIFRGTYFHSEIRGIHGQARWHRYTFIQEALGRKTPSSHWNSLLFHRLSLWEDLNYGGSWIKPYLRLALISTGSSLMFSLPGLPAALLSPWGLRFLAKLHSSFDSTAILLVTPCGTSRFAKSFCLQCQYFQTFHGLMPFHFESQTGHHLAHQLGPSSASTDSGEEHPLLYPSYGKKHSSSNQNKVPLK